MKRGDYMVHIYVEKMKELNVAEGTTVNPLIQIESLGQKGFTSSMSNIGGVGEVEWSEHIFLEAQNVEKRDAENAKISIKLMDKGMFKDAKIGEFEFDLSYIYFKD